MSDSQGFSLPQGLFQRDPGLITADMDGDLVMMSPAQGAYFGLGGIGPRLWELLENPHSVDTLREAVMAEFAIDRATCERDIGEFVSSLVDKGLVRQC